MGSINYHIDGKNMFMSSNPNQIQKYQFLLSGKKMEKEKIEQLHRNLLLPIGHSTTEDITQKKIPKPVPKPRALKSCSSERKLEPKPVRVESQIKPMEAEQMESESDEDVDIGITKTSTDGKCLTDTITPSCGLDLSGGNVLTSESEMPATDTGRVESQADTARDDTEENASATNIVKEDIDSRRRSQRVRKLPKWLTSDEYVCSHHVTCGEQSWKSKVDYLHSLFPSFRDPLLEAKLLDTILTLISSR